MSRRLVALNAVLVVIGLVCVGYLVRELRVPPPAPTARRPAAPAARAPAPAAPAPEAPAGSYTVVASRNLFSPTRTEAPVTAAPNAMPVSKPNLYGIILRDGAPVAYLEDPTTKRVAAYRLGDSVAGGIVKKIGADHVVLNRPEGEVNVRLRDPSKPRPVAPLPPPPGAAAPGVPPAGTPAVPPVATPRPPGQAVTPPPLQPPQVLPRRPLPPNLLRRLPPPASDAPAQR